MKCPCARIHERVSADDNVARIQQQTHLRSAYGVTHFRHQMMCFGRSISHLSLKRRRFASGEGYEPEKRKRKIRARPHGGRSWCGMTTTSSPTAH